MPRVDRDRTTRDNGMIRAMAATDAAETPTEQAFSVPLVVCPSVTTARRRGEWLAPFE